MLDFIFGLFSHDVGIDLGTANTLVLVAGKGIVIREPSVLARHKKTKKVLAVGTEAKKMRGKTPITIETIRPLRDGVISDFDAALAMVSHYIKLIHKGHGLIPKIPRPRVAIGIPSGVTEVERRAVQEVALSSGARVAYLIEEPMAAAIGAGFPINSSSGMMIVDIGGGTTEIAVISLSGIVVNKSIRIAGDEMDEAISSFARLKYSILLGEKTSEEVKLSIGSAAPLESEKQFVVRGRDLETGLPKSIKFNSSEIREALSPIVLQIVEGVAETIEETPPELVSDILERGIALAGGGSLLPGLADVIAERTKMPVWIAPDPLTCVVRGCGKVLEDEKLLNRVKVTGGLR